MIYCKIKIFKGGLQQSKPKKKIDELLPKRLCLSRYLHLKFIITLSLTYFVQHFA